MRKKILPKLLAVVLLPCLLLCGCGDTSNKESGSSLQPEISKTDNPPQVTPEYKGYPTVPPVTQTANDALDANAENVITLGVITRYNDEIMKMTTRFNEEQTQYKVKVVQYGYDDFIMDIMRKQGPDIFSMYDLAVDILAQKGILEDLTPYFVSSDVVNQEDILGSVWEAGTIGGKMVRLIPYFDFEGILVEKGYTNNGGWTVEDYFALAQKYPEGMINKDIADPANLFLNDLRATPELYIDWEAGTCSFDSSEFIELLEELKKYSKKTYDISPSGTPAERLHKKEYLTWRVQVYTLDNMGEYLHLKTMLGDEFELAGYPGVSDEPYYCMMYEFALGMNSFSSKKEGIWAFFEYLFSKPIQEEFAKGNFPARMDVLNQTLHDAMHFELNGRRYFSYNSFTQEMEEGRLDFTEEDRQDILEMLDQVKRPDVMGSGDITYIILDELKLFFDGSKSAKDTAAIIQNRVQLYLDEMR